MVGYDYCETNDNFVKLADVSQSQEEDMITGTQMGAPNYMAQQRWRPSDATTAKRIYRFGLMLREVWYGKRTFHGISAEELHEQVVQGRRLEHVQDRREPPNEWRDLMQC
nr:uncharacterized protein LOC131775108 [Pocillopora verrucosa]